MSTEHTDTREETELMVPEKQEAALEEGTWEGTYFQPAVDIYETDEGLTLLADMPGVERDDVTVDLRDNRLTITGRVRPVEERWRPLMTEYRSGHYMRQFTLGSQIDQERIEARLEDGVLTLRLPKVEEARPRQIPIG